jgi:hypothetical protein
MASLGLGEGTGKRTAACWAGYSRRRGSSGAPGTLIFHPHPHSGCRCALGHSVPPNQLPSSMAVVGRHLCPEQGGQGPTQTQSKTLLSFQYIPMPVLYGVFLYMGVASLNGIQVRVSPPRLT